MSSLPDVIPSRLIATCVLVTAVCTVGLRADSGSPRFTRLSVEDGLSQSSVQQILQDRKGLLWFGTQEGLNRFDGYRFTVHRARERDGFLRDHDITALVDDTRGDLWVGTSRGLYRHDLDTGRFDTSASPLDQLGILKLVRGADGLIYLIASDRQLWVLDPAAPDRRGRALTDGVFAPLKKVTALAAASGSAIWVVADGRLFKLENAGSAGKARVTEGLANAGAASVIAPDAQGNVWLAGGDRELVRFVSSTGRVDRFRYAPRNILTIVPAKDGAIWIGARRGGLTRLDPHSGDLTTYRHDPADAASLVGDDVASIYEDAGGSLWIGSWNAGASRFDPHAQGLRTIKHRAAVRGSVPNDVTAMSEIGGLLWFVSRSGVVAAGDSRGATFRTIATLSGQRRFTALGALGSEVLVGTSEGLVALDQKSGRERPLDAALRSHDLSTLPITAMRAAPGALWIASGKEVFRLQRESPRASMSVARFAVPIGGTASAFSTLASDRLWIGSDRGEIVRVDGAGSAATVVLRALDVPDPQARASFALRGFVSSVHEDGGGRLWIGTRRGLGRVELSSGKVSWLGEEHGLPSTNISGVVGDDEGRLWIGHNRGLTRLDPASGVMTHYGEADGAQGRGYAEGAWTRGASGLIYFAGEGITLFDPRQVRASPSRPRIIFTGLEILHRPVVPRWLDPSSPLERTIDAAREVTLAADATVFAVEMAPLDYVDPSSNRLMYRLDGFDREWIETGAGNRVATYTNLAPGRYVLRARAGTRNGVWSEREATLAIQILPPWWRTRTALVLWVALAVVLGALVRKSARRRARVKLALMERETLRRDSLTDALTGLHNRRFLNSWLDQEVPKLIREYRVNGPACGADLLLVLVDVDHFKSINDRYSHARGDRVLSRIAGVLKDVVRGYDLAVRWGGDEFLVVFRGLHRERAADSVERLRTAVEAAGSTGDAEEPATVSIGFAAFPFLPHEAEALSWEQTLELADHALRLTKRRQRNSYTGLRASRDVSAAAVREFLAGGAMPPGVEVVTSAASE